MARAAFRRVLGGAKELDHAKPDWSKPGKQTTGADGTFAIAFWPPPPYQFTLDIQHGARAAMAARWSTIVEGKTVDVGDVVMQLGVRVHGRVVDEAGRPLAKVQVNVEPGSERQDSGNSEVPTPAWSPAMSRNDGSFRCRTMLPPGPYHVTTSGDEVLAKPIQGTLVRGSPGLEITVVMKDRSQLPTISGKVVDENGQPVRSANLEAYDAVHGRSSTCTKSDGSFVLKRQGDSGVEGAGSVRVIVRHQDFEVLASSEAIAWGSKDVVLTLTRAGGLAVYVHDEAKRALTDFVVRVLPRESNRFSSLDHNVRARGPFAPGFAAVPGIGRGKWMVIVEFPSQDQRAPVFQPIEVTATDTLRVDLLAASNVQRRLRAVDSAGEPVVDAKVQVCDPVDGEWLDTTPLLTMDKFWQMQGMKKALVLGEGQTDAEGVFVLVGPSGRALGVFVRGKSQLPLRQGNVRLDDPTELTLVVSAGATLRGRVGPPEALAELHRLGGNQGTGARRQYEPSLHLMRSAGGTNEHLPAPGGETFAIAADGTFSIGGLPAGTWQIAVSYMVAHDGGASGRSASAGAAELRAGEVTVCDPDLRHILPGTLRGTLSKNGQPVVDTPFNLNGTLAGPAAAPGQPQQEWVQAKTDAAGRFEARVRPGTYRAVMAAQGARLSWVQLPSAEFAQVQVGEVTEQAFTVWTGQLLLSVRDAAGQPVVGLQVQAVGADADQTLALPASDAQGAIAVEVSAVTLTLRVLPKRLQSPEAQRKLWQEANAAGNRDPFAAHWLVLGSAAITTGQTTNVELLLPPEWEQ